MNIQDAIEKLRKAKDNIKNSQVADNNMRDAVQDAMRELNVLQVELINSNKLLTGDWCLHEGSPYSHEEGNVYALERYQIDPYVILHEKYEEITGIWDEIHRLRDLSNRLMKDLSKLKADAIKTYDALAGEWEVRGGTNQVYFTLCNISLHRQLDDYEALAQIIPNGGYNDRVTPLGYSPRWGDGGITIQKFGDHQIVFGDNITKEEFLGFCSEYHITVAFSEEFEEGVIKTIKRGEDAVNSITEIRDLLIAVNEG